MASLIQGTSKTLIWSEVVSKMMRWKQKINKYQLLEMEICTRYLGNFSRTPFPTLKHRKSVRIQLKWVFVVFAHFQIFWPVLILIFWRLSFENLFWKVSRVKQFEQLRRLNWWTLCKVIKIRSFNSTNNPFWICGLPNWKFELNQLVHRSNHEKNCITGLFSDSLF